MDVPEASPESIKRFWPASTIHHPARLHLDAEGPLENVTLALVAGLGATTIDAKGTAGMDEGQHAHLVLAARDVDVRELAPTAPQSRLGLTLDASGQRTKAGAIDGRVVLEFLGGKVGTNDIPPATIVANVSQRPPAGLSAHADVVVHEPSVRTRVVADMAPKGSSSTIAYSLDVEAPELDRVPQLGHAARGKVRIASSGDVDLGAKTIDAHVSIDATRAYWQENRALHAVVEGHATGELTDPHLDVGLRAVGVEAGGQKLSRAAVTIEGKAMSPNVEFHTRGQDLPDVDGYAAVHLAKGVTIDALHVALARSGEKALVTARSVVLEGGDLQVEGARIEGLGAPFEATLRRTPSTLRVRAKTAGLDLARVARLANVQKQLQAGTVEVDADLSLQRTNGRGHAMLDVTHATAGEARDLSAHVDVSLDGRKLDGTVHANLPGTATLDLAASQCTLAGGAPLLSSAAWKKAFGTADVALHADLAKLASLLPPADMPVSEARGVVDLKAHVARDGIDDVTPDVKVDVDTDGLVIAPKVEMARDIDGVLVHPPPPWRLAGVDFAIDAAIDGDTGAVRIDTKTHDKKGPLAELTANTAKFPYAAVLHHQGVAEAIRNMPFDVRVVVPERGLGTLPPLLQQPYVTGRVLADLSLKGPMLSPTMTFSGAVRHMGLSGHGLTHTMDMEITSDYDGKQLTAAIKAHEKTKELLSVDAHVQAVAAALLGASSTASPWTASVHAHMQDFPLQTVAVLDDKLVAGTMSGDLSLDGLHQDAKAKADLTIAGLSVGSVAYKSAAIHATADGKALEASLRIDQTDGFLETKAHAAASWGASIAPVLDKSSPLDATLSSKNFRIAALLPFAGAALDELDGRLDADTKAALDPRDRSAKLSGSLQLTRGTIEASAGGGELHDVTASVKLQPDGTITLEKLTASGMTGKLQATAVAHLKGLALESAHASLKIPRHSAVPLTAGGAELGDVDGRVDVTETTGAGGAMNVKVEVPKLDVALPEASSSSPRSLDAMKSVRIGAHRGNPGRFVLIDLDAARPPAAPAEAQAGSGLTLATHLADVHIVRGTQLAVDLDGNVAVSTGAATKVTGQIRLKRGGTLNVQGRTFEVESGTVTFVGSDPSNPEIVVKAGWHAPDGTVVYATFTGPLKTGKVTLSSEPSLPRDEIVQLLLFGSPDGTQVQTPSAGTENSAIATAGGEAAQPLNHMLNQLGLGAVTAKVDTSEASTPKPEIEVQIAKALSIELAVVLGQPPPGVNPDHTLVTLDWRFMSKWSLATTVGDAGTTIFDLLWQHRY
ncbi:MAG TPA: translocation/assembly module TamB domain-containing protein [Polyangiaceae bacterium]